MAAALGALKWTWQFLSLSKAMFNKFGDWVSFTWRSEPGSAYRVESTESLFPTNWQVGSEVIIAEGVRSGWTDCRGLSGKRFYRVVQSQ